MTTIFIQRQNKPDNAFGWMWGSKFQGGEAKQGTGIPNSRTAVALCQESLGPQQQAYKSPDKAHRSWSCL